jgi:hypothetical protein
VPNRRATWRQEDLGYCVLDKEFVFKANRNRTLLITADAQLLLATGHLDAFRIDAHGESAVSELDQQQKRRAANAGVFAFFRIGFHIKGRDDNDWVLPTRSEVFVNQFNNWREHPALEDAEEFRDSRPIANQANVSLQIMINRPWLDEKEYVIEGGVEEKYRAASTDLVIDGVALFVAGAENFTRYGPTIGLSGANLSAMLIDTGYTDSAVGFDVLYGTGTA